MLPHADGYWLTADNAAAAARRHAEVRDWLRDHGLGVTTIGLDIEMPHDDQAELVHRTGPALWRLWRGRRAVAVVEQAARDYASLVAQVRADGFRVETYHFPFALDERDADSRLFQRVLGTVDVRGDCDVLMLYRSVLPEPWGRLLVDGVGPGADAIAVGITGGGVASLAPAFEGRLLDRTALLQELARARRFTPRLYVFSLEGCADQPGLLDALATAELPEIQPDAWAPAAKVGRSVLRLALRGHHALHRVKRRILS